jgi:hypothetical protein
MRYFNSIRGPGAFALVAGLLGSSACSETALTGFVDDTEIQDPDVVVFAALGIAREHNDLMYAEGDGWYRLYMGVDEIVHDGNSQFETETSIGDFRDRRANQWYEQAHEALWASYKVIELAKLQFEPERFELSPIVARAWLNAGWSERFLGDIMCETVYQYGPFGGFNLAGLSDGREYDRGILAGQDSIFQRMAYAMEQAVAQADRALAAGEPPNPEDEEYFDPVIIRTNAYAGLAQARVALASLGVDPGANYAAAAAAAANVPNNAEEFIQTTTDLRDNEHYDISWDNDDFTAWGGLINGERWGSPALYLRDGPDDPRVQVAHCAEFETTDGALGDIFRTSNIAEGADVTECRAVDSRIDTESVWPKWNPRRDSWADPFGWFNIFRGTEMRLIEAEVALNQGDLGGFTAAINDARAHHGLDPIAQPATVGELEFPNAEDDAWSILDREYLLDGWLEGRRMFHLNRWNHPYVRDNLTMQPEHVGLVGERMACHPLPQNECNLNPDVDCPVLR